MARAVVAAGTGTDRLVIRTICTHVVFFHEAGFEYRTERRRGWRWVESGEALQPHDVACTFNDRIDPERFDATAQVRPGFHKLSCEVLSLRRHCVWVDVGQPMPAEFVPGTTGMDARAVRDVVLSFTYDGTERTLRHRARHD
jgi:hypothetical protein